MSNPEQLRKKASDYRDEAERLQLKAAQLENQANKEQSGSQPGANASGNPFL